MSNTTSIVSEKANPVNMQTPVTARLDSKDVPFLVDGKCIHEADYPYCLTVYFKTTYTCIGLASYKEALEKCLFYAEADLSVKRSKLTSMELAKHIEREGSKGGHLKLFSVDTSPSGGFFPRPRMLLDGAGEKFTAMIETCNDFELFCSPEFNAQHERIAECYRALEIHSLGVSEAENFFNCLSCIFMRRQPREQLLPGEPHQLLKLSHDAQMAGNSRESDRLLEIALSVYQELIGAEREMAQGGLKIMQSTCNKYESASRFLVVKGGDGHAEGKK